MIARAVIYAGATGGDDAFTERVAVFLPSELRCARLPRLCSAAPSLRHSSIFAIYYCERGGKEVKVRYALLLLRRASLFFFFSRRLSSVCGRGEWWLSVQCASKSAARARSCFRFFALIPPYFAALDDARDDFCAAALHFDADFIALFLRVQLPSCRRCVSERC